MKDQTLRCHSGFEPREVSSALSYYPPRAGWSRPVRNGVQRWRRRLGLERIHLPAGLSFFQLASGLLVPGAAIYARGWRRFGHAALISATSLVVIFFVFLGFPVGNLAFGLLLSLHVTSIGLLFQPFMARLSLGFRVAVSLVALMLLAAFIYTPAREMVQEHLFMPLCVHGRVVIVQRLAAASSLRRGEIIAYSLPESHPSQALYVEAGYGVGPILALAGDHIRFTRVSFEINGVARPRLQGMPKEGDLIVPEKHWLVWPDFDMSGHGEVPREAISAAMLHMAILAQDQYIGRPFKRWFGRRQIVL